MENLEIILKQEKNPYTKQLEPIIFFRDIKHLKGNKIECFDGCHEEATLNYFWNCKPATIKECENLLKTFKSLYNDKNISIKKRLTFK